MTYFPENWQTHPYLYVCKFLSTYGDTQLVTQGLECILLAAPVSPLHAAILCLWGLEFPAPGLLSVGYSRMYKA